MAYATIDSPKKYFEAKTYTGTGSTQSIGGLSFKPDMTWLKIRNQAYDHAVQDAVRGATKDLETSSTDAEQTRSMLTAFTSDGFTLGTDSQSNSNANTFVSWNWLGANTTASNTSGSISSTVSANTTSGFSIVSYTGNATAGATVGHGLGVVPKMIILKRRTGSAEDWYVYHGSLANTEVLRLNLNNAKATRADFNNTTPTSSVFTINSSDNVNASGSPFIAYCFADVKGFSKFSSFIGNGSTDGTFVYTGFTPAFVILKNATTGLTSWEMADNKRALFNVNDKTLKAETSGAEQTYNFIDFLSNGFKLRYSSDSNTSGNTIIYIAFASSPFVSSKGIPCTAR